MPRLLIVIPAYNEEENIVRVVDDLTCRFPQYDYVVVNDGSRDKTAALCRAHGYRLIDLPVNLGLAGAFQTGLRYAADNGYDCAMQAGRRRPAPARIHPRNAGRTGGRGGHCHRQPLL